MKRKPRVIWVVFTGGIYDAVWTKKPSEGYISGCEARGCEVVKYTKVIDGK